MAPTPARILLPLAAAALLAVASLALHQEVDALTALRNGLHDPDGMLKSWDPELVDPCTWFHITCSGNPGRVVRIDLPNAKLSGPLSPELAKLDQLQYIEMYGNNLQGAIPAEFGNLKKLVSLDLYNNDISGPIPPSLGELVSLEFLRIGHNRLTGTIPTELTRLSKLRVVDLSNNNLCGPIPTIGVFQNIPPSSFANNPHLGTRC